ncbi:MAG TPA: class I SAM-dependent methyltransferase [Candidatus Eisenbacteria bacterium]|nr:class I SAM-dependent methyltransferase [Candidatus Eisenbacteria bacterium]
MTTTPTLDEFLGKLVGDLGATCSAALVGIGDRLGLYKTLAGAGPQTPAELARHSGTDERYVREWLCAQAASGYVDYDPGAGTFSLNEVQRLAFADESSPAHFLGGFQIARSMFKDLDCITEAFRSGGGVAWHEHDVDLFCGTERFFRAGYNANLVASWIPALDGVEAKLQAGARVADVGCGHGASTIIMAQAYPRSTFVGFDYHQPSIVSARQHAEEAGVADHVSFETVAAKRFSGSDYDLVCIFDALHDMGDPVGAARHVRESLRPDGTWLVVEPFAGDRLEQNLNPVGRVFYSASTMICTPASRSQEVGLALGAQAGPKRLEEVCRQAGFTRFRVATQTPFNVVLEVRP